MLSNPNAGLHRNAFIRVTDEGNSGGCGGGKGGDSLVPLHKCVLQLEDKNML